MAASAATLHKRQPPTSTRCVRRPEGHLSSAPIRVALWLCGLRGVELGFGLLSLHHCSFDYLRDQREARWNHLEKKRVQRNGNGNGQGQRTAAVLNSNRRLQLTIGFIATYFAKTANGKSARARNRLLPLVGFEVES
jgi:hypothetical protein